MSFVATKSQFHVALDGVGLLLQGAPDRLAYKQEQAPVYGSRFASGDRSYNDLSQWWYFVQTSWAAGIKDIVSWLDDAQYYFSTNIDAISENGAIKLESGLVLDTTFDDQITVGSYETPLATAYHFIGTDQNASTKPAIFAATGGAYSNISSAWMPTNTYLVTEIIAHKLKVWFGTINGSTPYVVGNCDADGANNVDYSAAIGTACDAINIVSCYCIAEDGNSLWAGVKGTDAENYITKTVDAGANWTKVLNTGYEKVLCILPINGDIYFLTLGGKKLRFKFYSTADAITTTIYTFPTQSLVLGNAGQTGTASRRALVFFDGKVVITKRKEIWEYTIDTGDFSRAWVEDDNKNSISPTLAIGDTVNTNLNGFHTGSVNHVNRLYWANLTKDIGEHFFNGKRDFSDSDTTYGLKPLFSDGSVMYWVDNNNLNKLYKDSGYKGTADKNYLVFNNFDLVSGVDKIAYSTTIIFKPFLSGQSITVEYFLGELTSSSSWTVLGTASYALDGAVVTDKTFFFGDAVIFKKIWFRIKMAGGGADTPTMTDFVTEYLPVPTFKKNWSLNINCADDVKRLDGALVATTGRELKGRLERAWWTKSILDFQDLDYATTLVNDASFDATETTITVDSTADFPEQGRFRIDDEEITYTGKTPTTFTGCTRGARSTRAATHADDSVVNNAYKVLITDLSSRAPIALEDKELEYTVGVSLREV